MNITPSTIYWATRLDSLQGLLFAIGLFATAMALLTVIAFFCRMQDPDDKAANVFVKFSPLTFAVLIVSSLAYCLTPSTKEFAAIYVIPAIANNEKVQTVGNRLYDLAIEWMDELKPAKAKEAAK